MRRRRGRQLQRLRQAATLAEVAIVRTDVDASVGVKPRAPRARRAATLRTSKFARFN